MIVWFPLKRNISITMYENNTTHMAQLKEDTSNNPGQNTFHQNSFFTHELQQNGEIKVQQIHSRDNLAGLFTKILSISILKKLNI